MYAIHEKLACQERRLAEFEAMFEPRRSGVLSRLALNLRLALAGPQLRPALARRRQISR